jgi:hypothetical protein
LEPPVEQFVLPKPEQALAAFGKRAEEEPLNLRRGQNPVVAHGFQNLKVPIRDPDRFVLSGVALEAGPDGNRLTRGRETKSQPLAWAPSVTVAMEDWALILWVLPMAAGGAYMYLEGVNLQITHINNNVLGADIIPSPSDVFPEYFFDMPQWEFEHGEENVDEDKK